MARFRQQCWEKLGRQSEYLYCIIAGSKGEGLTKVIESDVDCLHTCRYISCTSRNPIPYNNVDDLTVLHMDRTNTAPGYTRLICFEIGTYINILHYAALTEPIAGNIYLSSDSWREECRQFHAASFPEGHLRQQPAQGPSGPVSDPSLDMHSDHVYAIVCDCPEILQLWIQRPRRHGWPSAEIIEEISTLEAHVVPVGFKGSPCQFLEWRICFTRAEIKLIQSLNDSQVKLIILLKMIAKSFLKPVCKDMTTYVVKNVVLWLAELYPLEYFTEQNLLSSLQRALRFIRQCLVGSFLPSYMIPERNLLANTMFHTKGPCLSERTRLCTTIDALPLEGPCVVLRCGYAWYMFYTAPETFRFFINTSRQIEIMYLLLLVCLRSDEPDAIDKIAQLQKAIVSILVVCEDVLRPREVDWEEFCLKQINMFLS